MADAPRVLLIRRRYLGDVVLLGSVLRNLRLHWPDARLDLLTEAAYAGVAALHPDASTSLAFPTQALEWPAFIRALRAARYSHVLDFDNTERTALVTRLTGAAVRATFNRELIVHRWPGLYTHAARVTPNRSMASFTMRAPSFSASSAKASYSRRVTAWPSL